MIVPNKDLFMKSFNIPDVSLSSRSCIAHQCGACSNCVSGCCNCNCGCVEQNIYDSENRINDKVEIIYKK